MYNSVTAQQIAEAPGLEGLDVRHLPAMMTDVFARIRASQLNAADTAQSNLHLSERLGTLTRVAETYEALFLSNCLNEQESRRAGFVAATTYSLVALNAEQGQTDDAFMEEQRISPLLSAALLFLAAGYYADAADIARRLFPQRGEYDVGLMRCIQAFALGDMRRANQIGESARARAPAGDATALLFAACMEAISKAASHLLLGATHTAEECATLLENTERASSYSFQFQDSMVRSVYAGPLQLAKLLKAATSKVLASSTLTIPAPEGVDTGRWSEFLLRLAISRPTLWDQHRDILNDGFLSTGESTVLSLPTGAGKTALAELKVAAHHLAGHKVVFITPTHALESQVTARMMELFGDDARSLVGDLTTEVDELPSVTICTPEACLTMLTLFPERFTDVGLFVLDECHILHAQSLESARRALDAMFCILEAYEAAPNADFLLMSAMVRNVDVLAAWVASATGRPCRPFIDEWKPTRQVRGCVVYAQSDVDQHIRSIRNAYRSGEADCPPVWLRNSLGITPYALFSLRDGWTRHATDYSLLQLLSGNVPLAAGGSRSRDRGWWLSPNRNKVAASLAKRTGALGIKTLVFCSDIKSTASIANEAANPGVTGGELIDSETEALRQLIIEFGSADDLYYTPRSATGVHHALLLQKERELIESLFKRDSGLDVLAATPTLAQGLNLPAEVVMIAGDDRYDPTAANPTDRQRLEAHELLNAAGRAGRAGHFSQGIVLIVPGRIVGIDQGERRISNRWIELQEQFARADQCLDVRDPFSALLDAIEEGHFDNENVKYALLRLHPHRDSTPLFRRRLAKTLWAHVTGAEQSARKIDAAVASVAGADLPDIEDLDPAMVELAQKSGAEIGWLQAILLKIMEDMEDLPEFDTGQWVQWLTALQPFIGMLKPETVESARKYGENETDESVRQLMFQVASAWISGAELQQIEMIFRRPQTRIPPKCGRTRMAILRWLPDVAYVAAIVRSLYPIVVPHAPVPICLQILQRNLRLGADSPEMLAFMHVKNYSLMRVVCHREFELLRDQIPAGHDEPEFRDVIGRVARAVRQTG